MCRSATGSKMRSVLISDNDLFGGCHTANQSCADGRCDDDADSKTRSTCTEPDEGQTVFGTAVCPESKILIVIQ